MKFLLMAVAIISSHSVCGAFEELRLPASCGVLPSDASTTCAQINPGSLGNSLNSSHETKQTELEESLDSASNNNAAACSADQLGESADGCFVSMSEESEGGLTPQTEVGASPSLKPNRADSSQNTEDGFNKHLLSLPFQDAGGLDPKNRTDLDEKILIMK